MSTSASNKITNSLLNEIKAVNKNIETNTKNINVNVGDVNLNTDTLEAKLDTFSGNGNNNIGEGSTKLQIYNYGRDVSAGNFKPMVVNSSAEQIVALSSVDNAVLDSSVVQQTAINTKLDSYAGGGNNNIGEGSTKLQIFNYGRDVAAGNYKPMVVNSSAEQIVALSAVDNAVLDEIQINGDNIQTKLDTLIAHNDGVEGKLDHLSDNSDTLNSSIAAVTAAVDALRVQNNGDLNDNIGKLDHISDNLDTLNTSINALTTQNNGDLNDAIGKLDHISDNLDTVDGSINTLEACVGSNKVNVNISSGAITGFSTAANQATIISHVDNVEAKLDTLETTANAIEVLQTAANTDLAAIEVLLTSANTDHAANEVLLGTIDADTDAIKTNTAACATDLAALEVLQTSTNSKIDTFDAVLDASLVKQTNIETLITSTNSKIDTFDAVLDASLVKQSAIAVDVAALEVLQTAANVDLAALEVLVTNQEAHLSNMDSLSRVNVATGSSQLQNNDHVGPEDCSKFSEICVIYLTTTSTSGKKVFITGSTASDGTFNPFAQMNLIQLQANSSGSVNAYMYGSGNSTQNNAEFIPCSYPFIKIQNISGTDLTDTDDIRIIGR